MNVNVRIVKKLACVILLRNNDANQEAVDDAVAAEDDNSEYPLPVKTSPAGDFVDDCRWADAADREEVGAGPGPGNRAAEDGSSLVR
jgi:hypothetical protein